MTDEPQVIAVNMESGAWEDELGKHLRVAVLDAGVAINIDLLPVEEARQDEQATVLLALVENLLEIVGETLERATNCPRCAAGEPGPHYEDGALQ